MEEKAFWVAFNQTPGLGIRRVLRLIEFFGTAKAAWYANESELLKVKGLGKTLVTSLIYWRRKKEPERIIEELNHKGIKVVTLIDKEYPIELKRIYDPPPVIYWRGKQLPNKGLKIAIVGTRRATPYGLKVAETLSADLVAAGVGIVSGLARGIDAAAHKGVIKQGGMTWGVLGCGVDVVYPPEHKNLYHQVMERGAILSEYPPGTRPEARNFPARNRIISGLTAGIVVVESAKRSGALITADLALEQNRDVFAVPGPITSRCSEGPNNLIKQGAKVVTQVEDILEEYNLKPVLKDDSKDKNEADNLTTNEEKVLAGLSLVPTHIDAIISMTGLSPGELNNILIQLEIRQLIRRMPGGFYIRC
ncbi:MAG: processing protein [Clostridia bacterium]|nr:processing protein [Clostridia bacterium]